MVGILLKQLLEEETCGCRHMVRELELLLADVLVKFLVIGASEGELTAEKGVQEDAKGPDISRRTGVLDLANDLRSHIGWSSTEYLDLPIMRNASGESKINQLDSLFCLVQQYVLQLDVPMRHISTVAVVNGLDYLAPQEFGLKLRHLSIWFHLEVSMETSSIDVLHYQEDFFP